MPLAPTTRRLTATELLACDLVYGNAAKVYDLALVMETADAGGALSVIDLGCGTAETIAPILKTFPQIHYVGIEPSERSATQARDILRDRNATIFHQTAYSLPPGLNGQFDFALSFSVLEHVYDRDRYLQTAHDALRLGGRLLINYDNGHFFDGSPKEVLKALMGRAFAAAGKEGWYQRRVMAAALSRSLRSANLRILETKFFNVASLKTLSNLVPAPRRHDYQAAWLESELVLNDVVDYTDALAHVLSTVNLIVEAT